jgi:thiol-disulfide isomerase/thioredoxin
LAQKRYDDAALYAKQTYEKARRELNKRSLDREPNLPIALGASVEVQAQVLAAKGQRAEALALLEGELERFKGTSVQARIKKNINLLSMVGKPAPALEGVTLPKGKAALLFFWAHWCTDCRAEAPILAQLKKEFAGRGVAFIGPTQKYGYVGAVENVAPAIELKYIEQIRNQFYGAVIDGPTVVSERNFMTYGVSSTPTLALVDAQGIIRLYHPGGMSYAELRAALERVVNRTGAR